jgi:phosphatidylglycerol:prolipoprotein diacylglycerol transferase
MYAITIDSYTLLYIAAIIVAAILLRHALLKNNYHPYLYIKLIVVAVFAMFVGGKVYYILANWDEFLPNKSTVIFGMSGFGWCGAFISGCFSIVLTLRIMKIPILKTFDIIAPIFPISYAIGRIGCFLGGCCHGVPSELPWAMSFPYGQYPNYVKVHPTQLYDSVANFFIFLILWRLRERKLQAGTKFGLYLICSGISRFIIEIYRMNPKVILQMTVPQIISILSVLIGMVILDSNKTLKPIINFKTSIFSNRRLFSKR